MESQQLLTERSPVPQVSPAHAQAKLEPMAARQKSRTLLPALATALVFVATRMSATDFPKKQARWDSRSSKPASSSNRRNTDSFKLNGLCIGRLSMNACETVGLFFVTFGHLLLCDVPQGISVLFVSKGEGLPELLDRFVRFKLGGFN